MLRSSLCLLFTALFMSVAFAAPQQGYTDVQSLQYEFGKRVLPTAPVQPVVYAPVERGCGCAPVHYCAPVRCCTPVYAACRPCYAPCYTPRCYPVSYRRACVRSVYYSPYACGCR